MVVGVGKAQQAAPHLFSAVPAFQPQQQPGQMELQGAVSRAVAHSLVVVVQGPAVLVCGDQGCSNLGSQVTILGLLLQSSLQCLHDYVFSYFWGYRGVVHPLPCGKGIKRT